MGRIGLISGRWREFKASFSDGENQGKFDMTSAQINYEDEVRGGQERGETIHLLRWRGRIEMHGRYKSRQVILHFLKSHCLVVNEYGGTHCCFNLP